MTRTHAAVPAIATSSSFASEPFPATPGAASAGAAPLPVTTSPSPRAFFNTCTPSSMPSPSGEAGRLDEAVDRAEAGGVVADIFGFHVYSAVEIERGEGRDKSMGDHQESAVS